MNQFLCTLEISSDDDRNMGDFIDHQRAKGGCMFRLEPSRDKLFLTWYM